MPAGKAIALAAMPTAVLMGMGFTPKLALAEDQPASRSLTADEYKECVAALEDAEKGDTATATPSPSASATESPSDGGAEPSPSATSGSGDSGSGSGDSDSGEGSSADSGSADEAEPTPSASAEAPATKEPQAAPTPSPSETEKGVLETIGDTVTGVVGGVVDGITGGGAEESPSPAPAPSASATPSPDASEGADAGSGDAADPAKETTDKVTDAVEDTAEDAGDTASEATEEPTEEPEATATPSPSASPTTDVDDCPVATDAEGGVDNTVPLPDDPWYLNASSLTLKGASYKGIVEVRTANGTTKKVLKYVISNGTDIGDLHQTVKDEQSGKTYHVQAAKGSTSTIRDGDTVMYTESISGNLLGLIPITFDPENPPPLDIPLIYFTKVKVVQAGQFGGTLHVPGLHQYVTD
jgi:hypothetical protein